MVSGCHHSGAWIEGGRSYADACIERDQFVADFPDRFVSPVERAPSGWWGWRFCTSCVRSA